MSQQPQYVGCAWPPGAPMPPPQQQQAQQQAQQQQPPQQNQQIQQMPPQQPPPPPPQMAPQMATQVGPPVMIKQQTQQVSVQQMPPQQVQVQQGPPQVVQSSSAPISTGTAAPPPPPPPQGPQQPPYIPMVQPPSMVGGPQPQSIVAVGIPGPTIPIQSLQQQQQQQLVAMQQQQQNMGAGSQVVGGIMGPPPPGQHYMKGVMTFHQPTPKKGKKPGSASYTKPSLEYLISLVQRRKPRGPEEWSYLAEEYNMWTQGQPKEKPRTGAALSMKFKKLASPSSCSPLQMAARQAESSIYSQDPDDYDSTDESDKEDAHSHTQSHLVKNEHPPNQPECSGIPGQAGTPQDETSSTTPSKPATKKPRIAPPTANKDSPMNYVAQLQSQIEKTRKTQKDLSKKKLKEKKAKWKQDEEMTKASLALDRERLDFNKERLTFDKEMLKASKTCPPHKYVKVPDLTPVVLFCQKCGVSKNLE